MHLSLDGQVAPRVRALCVKHGIAYRQLGFLEATREVVDTLRHVADAARRKLSRKRLSTT